MGKFGDDQILPAYISATHACMPCMVRMCVCVHDVYLYGRTLCTRSPDNAVRANIHPAWHLIPSPVDRERAVQAVRARVRRMPASSNYTPNVPLFLGSAAKEKPLRLAQEPACAVVLDAATAAKREW